MNEIYIKLGELLLHDRQQKGISLEDLSTRLKISEENLKSIERGDTKAVASELYFNLFAKSYCEALGIDYSRTIEAMKAEREEKPAESKTAKGKSETGESDGNYEKTEAVRVKKLVVIFGAIVVGFALFITAYKIYWEQPITSDEQGRSNETGEQRSSGDAELASFDWDVPKYTPAKPLRLKLTPRGESWATILADGDTVIFRNLVPGRTYEAEAQFRLLVSVGVPRSVDVELNDQTVTLADPETRRISRVYIDQMNLEQYLNPQPVQLGTGTGGQE